MAFGLRESGGNFLADSEQLVKVGFEVSHSREKIARYLFLLIGIHGNGGLRETVAFKEVWHEHGCAGMSCQAIRALESLWPDTKDVINVNYDFGWLAGANDVYE